MTEQDAEIYQLSKRIVFQSCQRTKSALAAVAEHKSQSAGDMPANEKPPHY